MLLKMIIAILLFAVPFSAFSDDSTQGIDLLIGTWTGPATYAGESAVMTMRFKKDDKGDVTASFDLLRTNIQNAEVGKVVQEGNVFKVPPFEFQIDAGGKKLTGQFGRRKIPFELTKDAPLDKLAKLGPAQKKGQIVWTFSTKGAIWSSPAIAGETVIFGSNDDSVYALNIKTGKLVWPFKTGGDVLGRPTVSGDIAYVVSDDGYLYKLDVKSGKEVWRFDTGGGSVKRSYPAFDPESKYDYFTSNPAISNGVLFLGSPSGKFFALDEGTGKEKWQFQAGDMIRSTPVVADGLVFFGSWDHFVYALDEKTGALRWKQDTVSQVTPSPVYSDGLIYIGSRSADVFAFDAATGNVKWKYFYWFSWVESTGTVRDGVLYVGSSDYQLMFALDTKSGKPLWSFDTDGSAWSSPAVTEDQVFIGTVGTVGYMADHHGGFFAVNRSNGKEEWRLTFDPIPNEFTSGVISSPAVAQGLVFFGGLDGKFYAVSVK
jgi:eukaryotic-like serine/threonine-protein kinase